MRDGIEELNEVVFLMASSIKAFLEAFDPLGRTLERLVDGGNEVQVLVTAREPGREGRRVTYLIEVSQSEEETSGTFHLSTADQELLRGWGIEAERGGPGPACPPDE